jgi:hypothetical protein
MRGPASRPFDLLEIRRADAAGVDAPCISPGPARHLDVLDPQVALAAVDDGLHG